MLCARIPGSCPWKSKSSPTAGENNRQCVDPPKWNIPSWSPFFTRCPSYTVISQVETSAIPTGSTHTSPIEGLSASMKITARVATSVMYACDSFPPEGSYPSAGLCE
jgi:hypothetical protein